MKINFIAPLKPVKISERIIYGNGSNFKMADTRTGDYLGRMKAVPMLLKTSPFYKNKKPIMSLYINDLWIMPFARRKKAGSDFVKFAKYLSRKNNCEGRVYTLPTTMIIRGMRRINSGEKWGLLHHLLKKIKYLIL